MTSEIKKEPLPHRSTYVLQRLNFIINDAAQEQLTNGDIVPQIIEAPLKTGLDYGINIAALASSEGINTPEGVAALSSKVKQSILNSGASVINNVQESGSFLNFEVNMSEFGNMVIDQILDMESAYGHENIGNGKRIIIDMSAPNIAKEMSYGHLRSTVIGDSLSKIYSSLGYEVIKDNHIGDWGTQFGKIIEGINRWSSKEEILNSKHPVADLVKIYVDVESQIQNEKIDHFMEQIKDDSSFFDKAISFLGTKFNGNLEDFTKEKVTELLSDKDNKSFKRFWDRTTYSDLENSGQAWFAKLEQGDSEALEIWKMCVDLSKVEFQRIYDVLGVNFNITLGESFYVGMLPEVINVVESTIGRRSDGALIIDMSDVNLGVEVVQKTDGSSLYFTRDLACAMYRQNMMGADGIIYVVGEDQKDYFNHLLTYGIRYRI